MAMQSVPTETAAGSAGVPRLEVASDGSQWILRQPFGEPLSRHASSADAVAAAKKSLRRQGAGGEVAVFTSDGAVCRVDTVMRWL